MSIRRCLGVEVPELTARVARASNPAGTTAMWVRDRLDGLWADEDFAGWYPRDGRPGISPAQLATVRHHGRGSVRGRRLPGRGGRGPGGWDGLGNQQLAGLAAEHRADYVQADELDGVRAARPQARHLPRADDHAPVGEHLPQLAGLPDAAAGGGQPEVPLHDRLPLFSMRPGPPAARRAAAGKASFSRHPRLAAR